MKWRRQQGTKDRRRGRKREEQQRMATRRRGEEQVWRKRKKNGEKINLRYKFAETTKAEQGEGGTEDRMRNQGKEKEPT